jgi:hypothetical protein
MWWVEGMATWGGMYASAYVSTNHKLVGMMGDPSKDLYDRSYDAMPLWVFLQGQKSATDSGFFAPLYFLQTYGQNGNSREAFFRTLVEALGRNNINMGVYLNVLYANMVGTGWLGNSDGLIHSPDNPNYVSFTNYLNQVIPIPLPAASATLPVKLGSPQEKSGSLEEGTVSLTVTNSGLLYLSMVEVTEDGKRAGIKVSTASSNPATSFRFTVDFAHYHYLLVMITAGDIPGGASNIAFNFVAWINDS